MRPRHLALLVWWCYLSVFAVLAKQSLRYNLVAELTLLCSRARCWPYRQEVCQRWEGHQHLEQVPTAGEAVPHVAWLARAVHLWKVQTWIANALFEKVLGYPKKQLAGNRLFFFLKLKRGRVSHSVIWQLVVDQKNHNLGCCSLLRRGMQIRTLLPFSL